MINQLHYVILFIQMPDRSHLFFLFICKQFGSTEVLFANSLDCCPQFNPFIDKVRVQLLFANSLDPDNTQIRIIHEAF